MIIYCTFSMSSADFYLGRGTPRLSKNLKGVDGRRMEQASADACEIRSPTTTCRGGEIGIHDRFRTYCRKT